MSFIKWMDWLEANQRFIKIAIIPLLVILTFSIYVLVYYTGGIKFVYSHSMYVPIVLGALVYGVRGGIFFALLGGVTLGPFMPIDVSTGEMQNTVNWLYRTGFFVLIGTIGGLASDGVRAYVKKIKWAATHDDSTGLFNRNALIDDIRDVTFSDLSSTPNLLLIASLNNTRHLKMAYGADVIDSAIDQISTRFENKLKELGHTSCVYRADTGSISTLVKGIHSDKMLELLDCLVSITKKPFVFLGVPIHVDFRMGFVPFKKLDESPQRYIHFAEAAMNKAHEKFVDYQSYSGDIDKIARDNMSILGELVDAIESKQLELHYQPKIDAKTRKVIAVEALMRWQHPERGFISPGIFIPCAEQSTLIHEITRFALVQAMQQMVRWKEMGVELPIAVNISPLNLNGAGFANIVVELLNHYKLDGSQLELEVTEGALIVDMETTKRELDILANHGIKISIDDFGTGYSSLQYLDKLPIYAIKIDQSFTKRIFHDDSSDHIVDATISLGHKLEMGVIAEGVEDKNTYDYLLDRDCDVIQGYFISRPQSEKDFNLWLTSLDNHTVSFA